MTTSRFLRAALIGSAIVLPALAAGDASAQRRSYENRGFEGQRRPPAQGRYDGQWVAAFITQRGNCEASYALSLSISGGRISASQGGVSGRVDRAGRVSGIVSGQQGSARAFGRLSLTAGQGRWNAPSRGCTGVWTAQRSSM